jgi:hypothetical protein
MFGQLGFNLFYHMHGHRSNLAMDVLHDIGLWRYWTIKGGSEFFFLGQLSESDIIG